MGGVVEPSEYCEPLVTALTKCANSRKADEMARYMKGKFDYFGVQRGERDTIVKAHLKEFGLPDIDNHDRVILRLWNGSGRELQYLALEILYRTEKSAPKERIRLYEELIVTRSWWDTVDMIAQKVVGPHLKRNSDMLSARIEAWRRSDDIWLNRTAILFQNRYGGETDFALLSSLAEQFAGSGEFFIQKAIGWSLRQYAKIDPEAVADFVDLVPLSPLSRREALKHIEKG